MFGNANPVVMKTAWGLGCQNEADAEDGNASNCLADCSVRRMKPGLIEWIPDAPVEKSGRRGCRLEKLQCVAVARLDEMTREIS